jgi:type IV secretion system protein VirB6
MAIICFQAPSLASALTGGAAVQQGIQMVQNTMMVAGIWSASASAARASGPATTGGVIRAGEGLAFTAGRAAGSIGSGAGVLVRQGYERARLAAYRLAALRGAA